MDQKKVIWVSRAENVLENTFNESEPIEHFCELKSGDWVIIQLGNLKYGYYYQAGVVGERKGNSVEVRSRAHRILLKPGNEQRIRKCKLMR